MSEQTEIVEFKKSEAALAVLRVKYAIVPDFTTKEGYEEGRQGIAELRTLRTTLDKARLKLNADDQARIKYRNSEAKRITGELVALEDPLKVAKGEFDMIAEREAEAVRKVEEDRVAAIEFRMGEMTAAAVTQAGMSVDTIDGCLQGLDKCYADFDFQEFAEPAGIEYRRVYTVLMNAKLEREKFDAENAELEKAKEEMRLQKEELAKEQERQRVINEEAEAKIKAAGEALEVEKAKAREELQEQQRMVDDRIEKQRIAEELVEAEKVAKENEVKRVKAEAAEAAKMEAIRPEVDKVRDWVLKLRFIDGPGGIKDKILVETVQGVMEDLNYIATNTCDKLERIYAKDI